MQAFTSDTAPRMTFRNQIRFLAPRVGVSWVTQAKFNPRAELILQCRPNMPHLGAVTMT